MTLLDISMGMSLPVPPSEMGHHWSPQGCQERPSPHSPALHHLFRLSTAWPEGPHLTCHRGDPGGPRGSLPLWDHSPNSPGTCGKALPGRPGSMSALAVPAMPQCQPPPSAGLGLIATAQPAFKPEIAIPVRHPESSHCRDGPRLERAQSSQNGTRSETQVSREPEHSRTSPNVLSWSQSSLLLQTF